MFLLRHSTAVIDASMLTRRWKVPHGSATKSTWSNKSCNQIRTPVWSRRLSDGLDPPASKTIFSGIQPTGVPHLGNYLGALQRWVQLQNEATPDTTLIYSLVDLHAITIRQEPEQLRKWKKDSLAMLLAVGLDPERSVIFHQSDASTGYLSRMTQWKDKTSNERDNSERLKLGLFSYPVLQAADVLVHGATHVPVGHDQAQHLEFAREVAIGFNHTFGSRTLVVPETLISPAKRIMSLAKPTSKMSKSDQNEKSRIMLTDTEDMIRSKVKAAVTDSETSSITYEPERRPGVSNLVDILFHCLPHAGYEDQAALCRDMAGVSFKALKDTVVRAVEDTIGPIRERYEDVRHDEQMLDHVAMRGAEKARQSAAVTIDVVKHAVGLSLTTSSPYPHIR
ncbi:Tryptophan--tRNA ligase, mitochondrial [Extremus antarcticus]|uniref:tryptophan--tRNA ligase n=1 Tax=Extremus antarcticus TaxID=702011 RepID=A0AAJ0G8T0_9PEZI|nr:Tryptophan--tRNA ligase, mitochondrial [Extremus antarcticus]